MADLGTLPAAYAGDPLWQCIWNSLATSKGALFCEPDFGSEINAIKTVSDNSIGLMQQTVTRALQWLVDAGRIRSVAAEVTRDRQSIGRLNIVLTIIKGDFTAQKYELFVQVL